MTISLTSPPAAHGLETATPAYFGARGQLFGWVHLPAGAQARAAVVLCPPLGRELTSSHFAYRRLARELAGRGIAALRFDYEGSGDSAGDDSCAPASWITDIQQAFELAAAIGAPTIGAVGMRMGALLALEAAQGFAAEERGLPLGALVLWDPCSSGAEFLRAQRALIRFGTTVRENLDPANGIEVPGSVFSPVAAAGIRRLGLDTRTGVRVASRTLLLERRTSRLPYAEVESLSATSVAPVERDEVSGQEELLDVEPLHQRIPDAAIARIAGWLDSVVPGVAAPVRVPVSCRSELELPEPAGRVLERPVRLGPADLFGISAVPAPEVLPPGTGNCGPVVLFLNSGNDWHAGPGRSWVTLARTLAAGGLSSVRFDMSGLGDSPARGDEQEHIVRAPAAFDDVIDAAAAASGGDARNVVLVGLCSGAYQALESGLVLRPAGVVAINPLLRFAPPEMAEGPIDPRRRICRPKTSAVSAYRRLPIPAALRLPRRLAWRAANALSPQRRPTRWLSELLEAECDVLIVGGEEETTPLLSASARDLRAITASGRLRIEVMPGLDHALLWSAERDRVLGLVAQHLLRRFAPTTTGTTAPVAPGHETKITACT